MQAEYATQSTQTAWYALAVRSRCEKAVAKKLQELHIEHFLPMINRRKVWSDRIKEVKEALFPGYIFVHCELNARLRYQLLDQLDVIALVGYSTEHIAVAIPDEQIEAVQKIVAADPDAESTEIFVEGVKVRVINGALRGIEGVVLERPDGQHRLFCNIPLMGRAVKSRISAQDIVPIIE